MTGADLAKAVMEGEDPKKFLRLKSQELSAGNIRYKRFIEAYFTAMFWATRLPPFGHCPGCGNEGRVLDREMEFDTGHDYVCAQCSEKQPNEEPPMEDNYSLDDLSPEFKRKSIEDCINFYNENADDIATGDDERAGHDFWLTREGHGAGFWDGDWDDEIGSRLTDAAHQYGEVYIYVGDDGKIYS